MIACDGRNAGRDDAIPGAVPPYLQVVALAFLGAVLGIATMVPLRRLLIVKAHDELPLDGRLVSEVSAGAVATAGILTVLRGGRSGAR